MQFTFFACKFFARRRLLLRRFVYIILNNEALLPSHIKYSKAALRGGKNFSKLIKIFRILAPVRRRSSWVTCERHETLKAFSSCLRRTTLTSSSRSNEISFSAYQFAFETLKSSLISLGSRNFIFFSGSAVRAALFVFDLSVSRTNFMFFSSKSFLRRTIINNLRQQSSEAEFHWHTFLFLFFVRRTMGNCERQACRWNWFDVECSRKWYREKARWQASVCVQF